VKASTQAQCERWRESVAPILGDVAEIRVEATDHPNLLVICWADEPGLHKGHWNKHAVSEDPSPKAVEAFRLFADRLGYPKRRPPEEAHMLHVRLLGNERLGPTPDPAWMASMWQYWLQAQMSSVVVLPCPDSRTELVATWVSPAGGPRHAFRFLGGVVLPTPETVGELAHNLRELSRGLPLSPRSLLPEPLHFEQVVGVLEVLTKRADAQPPEERGSFLQGIVDKLSKGTPSAALPPELEVVAQATNPALEQAYTEVGRALAEQRRQQAEAQEAMSGAPAWFRQSSLEAPRDTVEDLRKAQARVGGFVIDDPHPQAAEATGAPGERPMVLRRAVAVALVESPVDLAVCREQGGLRYVPAGTPFVHIDPEATDEGLRLLRVALDMERERRARGDE
jgi:hypothetical protein